MATPGRRPKLVAIVGPTASGKSALAMKVAQNFNGEIVSADSWMVYRGFDIGTAKPTKAERAEVKHHLIDIVDASAGFNAAKFKKLAEAAITQVEQKGKLPILAGGTGLYIDSVLFDFGFLPKASSAKRLSLSKQSIPDLLGLAERQKINLDAIDIRNKRRIIRAIEAKGERPTKKGLRANTLLVGLKSEGEDLKKLVEARVDTMLKNGLEQEAKRLAKQYGWQTESMKGIGYSEWQDYFLGRKSIEEVRTNIISATMNLAKRQRTWFKRNPHIHWFGDAQAAYDFIASQLSK